MLYSIIITVYNCESFLFDTISSVLNQTYDDFELVIVNDSSTDNSLNIIKSFKDPRIKLINNIVNYGCGISRQIGINNSIGKYTLFLDGDDTIEPNCLSTLNNYIQNEHDIIIFGMNHENRIIYPKYSFLQNKCIKRTIWNDIEHSDLRLNEDKTTLYRLFSQTDNVIEISHVLYNHIYRSNSLSHSSKDRLLIYSILGVIQNMNWEQTHKIKFIKNRWYKTYNKLQIRLLFNELNKYNIDESNQTEYYYIKQYVDNIYNR